MPGDDYGLPKMRNAEHITMVDEIKAVGQPNPQQYLQEQADRRAGEAALERDRQKAARSGVRVGN